MNNVDSLNRVCRKLNIICTADGYITNDYYHTHLGMLDIMPVKYILPADEYFLKDLKQYKPNDMRIKQFSSIIRAEKRHALNEYIFTTKSNHLPTALDLVSNYLRHEYKELNHCNHYFGTILRSLAQTKNQKVYSEVKTKYDRITALAQHRIFHAEYIKAKYVLKC